MSAGPGPCPLDRRPYAGTKGMGRSLLACARSNILPRPTSPSEGPSAMSDEDRDACDAQHGAVARIRSGRGEGATSAPGPCCCRNPLSITMCAAVEEAGQLDGEWSGNPWSAQGCRLAESQALRLHQAREQRQGLAGRAGWQAGWLGGLNGTGPCCVRFRSHTSRK